MMMSYVIGVERMEMVGDDKRTEWEDEGLATNPKLGLEEYG